MDNLGDIIRKLREGAALPLRTVAAYLETDPAILSKIETGKRRPSRDQVVKLAKYFKVNEDDLLVAWLSDKLVYEVGDEKMGLKAMQVAEEVIAYKSWGNKNINSYRKALKEKIRKYFMTQAKISSAWIFGSFARGDDSKDSDIDILIDVFPRTSFTLFDIAGIQHDLESIMDRKVDVVMLTGIRPEIKQRIEKDMKLIYEAG